MKTIKFEHLLILLNLIYIIVDIPDYILNRFNIDQSIVASYPYESNLESFFKWGVCLIQILILTKVIKIQGNNLYYFLIGISIIMVIYFFINGPYEIATTGSFVHNLHLIYIISIITLIYSLYKLVGNGR